MADVANKYSENVDGKFYVDDQCIDCDLCRETAPANFKWHFTPGCSHCPRQCHVSKQPENIQELISVIEAMRYSCVEAIRYRGTDASVLKTLAASGMKHLCDAL